MREHGQIANTPTPLKATCEPVDAAGSDTALLLQGWAMRLRIQRQLTAQRQAMDCVVVAPSLIPRKPGDRIKTDRRDERKGGDFRPDRRLFARRVPDGAAANGLADTNPHGEGLLRTGSQKRLASRAGVRPPVAARKLPVQAPYISIITLLRNERRKSLLFSAIHFY